MKIDPPLTQSQQDQGLNDVGKDRTEYEITFNSNVSVFIPAETFCSQYGIRNMKQLIIQTFERVCFKNNRKNFNFMRWICSSFIEMKINKLVLMGVLEEDTWSFPDDEKDQKLYEFVKGTVGPRAGFYCAPVHLRRVDIKECTAKVLCTIYNCKTKNDVKKALDKLILVVYYEYKKPVVKLLNQVFGVRICAMTASKLERCVDHDRFLVNSLQAKVQDPVKILGEGIYQDNTYFSWINNLLQLEQKRIQEGNHRIHVPEKERINTQQTDL